MKSKFTLITCLIFFALSVKSQNNKKESGGYRIEVNIPKSKGAFLHLVRYYNGLPYTLDSVMVSQQGKAVFSSVKKLPEGQYLIYKKPDIQMEILVGKEQNNIKLYLDESNLTNSKVSGSPDTELFWNYINQVSKISSELEPIEKQLSITNNQLDKERLLGKKNNIENRILEFISSQVEMYPKQWFGIFLKGTKPVEMPIEQPTTVDEVNQNKNYIREHYFDNIDLTDARYWNTNYFPKMVESYLYKQLPQIPDTVAFEASRLVSKTASDSTSFKEMLSFILNDAMQSKYMGMENVWAKLTEDYILDKDVSWIGNEKIAQIGSLYEALKFNRIGMHATNLRLSTVNGDTINTNGVNADFTILYFFNPTCGHCLNTTSALRDHIYPKYKDKGLRIIAIDIDTDTKKWKEYIENNNISEWINCADPNYKSAYWMYYDTSGVPMIYVLNKDKKIIARKVDESNLEKLLGYYIK